MVSIDELKPLLESTNASDRLKAFSLIIPNYGNDFPRKDTALDVAWQDRAIALELLSKFLDDGNYAVKTKAKDAIKRLLMIHTRFAQPQIPQICIACGIHEPLSEHFKDEIQYEKGIVEKSKTESLSPLLVNGQINPYQKTKITYEYQKSTLKLVFRYCPDCAKEQAILEREKIIANVAYLMSVVITIIVIWQWSANFGISESAGLIVIIVGIVLVIAIAAILLKLSDWLLHKIAGISNYSARQEQVKNAVSLWFYPIGGTVSSNEAAFLVDDHIIYSFGNDSFRDQFIELNRSLLLNQATDNAPKSA